MKVNHVEGFSFHQEPLCEKYFKEQLYFYKDKAREQKQKEIEELERSLPKDMGDRSEEGAKPQNKLAVMDEPASIGGNFPKADKANSNFSSSSEDLENFSA